MAAAVFVKPNDLSRGVDGEGFGEGAACDIDRRDGTAAVQEAVELAAAVFVKPNDLS